MSVTREELEANMKLVMSGISDLKEIVKDMPEKVTRIETEVKGIPRQVQANKINIAKQKVHNKWAYYIGSAIQAALIAVFFSDKN